MLLVLVSSQGAVVPIPKVVPAYHGGSSVSRLIQGGTSVLENIHSRLTTGTHHDDASESHNILLTIIIESRRSKE